MIDFTNRETLITVKVALIRAMNSLDNEIADVRSRKATEQDVTAIMRFRHKQELLEQSLFDMQIIYSEIDTAIIAATR